MPDILTGTESGSIQIRDILNEEVGTANKDCWRLTLHTPTVDVNFEGYGEIAWTLINAGLNEVEGVSLDEAFTIAPENKDLFYWTGFVVVDGYRNWVVLDTSSNNIISWRKIPGLGHKVEFLLDVSYKEDNIGNVGSFVKNSR